MCPLKAEKDVDSFLKIFTKQDKIPVSTLFEVNSEGEISEFLTEYYKQFYKGWVWFLNTTQVFSLHHMYGGVYLSS